MLLVSLPKQDGSIKTKFYSSFLINWLFIDKLFPSEKFVGTADMAFVTEFSTKVGLDNKLFKLSLS